MNTQTGWPSPPNHALPPAPPQPQPRSDGRLVLFIVAGLAVLMIVGFLLVRQFGRDVVDDMVNEPAYDQCIASGEREDVCKWLYQGGPKPVLTNEAYDNCIKMGMPEERCEIFK